MTLNNILKDINDKQVTLNASACFNPFAAVYAVAEAAVIAGFCEGKSVKLTVEKVGNRFRINDKEVAYDFAETSAEEMTAVIKEHFAWEGVLKSQVKVDKISEDKYEIVVSF